MKSKTKAQDPIKIKLKESFSFFLFSVWKELGLPDPAESIVQKDIADYLQFGPTRKVISAFRGCGKSYITGAYVLWLLYRNPKLNILVVSASKQRADEFSTFCLNLLERTSWLSHLKPRDDQRSSKVAFDVNGAEKASQFPSVRSAGITGQITGSRADYIIADDVEIPNNSDTDTNREKLAQQITDFENIIKPVKTAEIIFLGTPQTEMSIYNGLPEKGYSVRIWPARYPYGEFKQLEGDDGTSYWSHSIYGIKLAPMYRLRMMDGLNKPWDPVWATGDRFDDADLMKRELAQGKSNHALQFMLDTSLSDVDKYPLKLSDLIVADLEPLEGPTEVRWTNAPDKVADLPTVGLQGDRYYEAGKIGNDIIPYQGAVMFVDPSGRGKDETAWAVVAMLMGRMFVLDAGGARGGYDDTLLENLLRTAKKFRVNRILVEPNFGDGMFAKLLGSKRQDIYNVMIEDAKWSRMQKEAKIIDTLEPVMNQHKLVVARDLVQRDYKSTESLPSDEQQPYRLFYQLTRLTRERGSLKHDDRLDALAGAVAYWTELAGVHEESVREAERTARFMRDAQHHLDNQVFGPNKHRPKQTIVQGSIWKKVNNPGSARKWLR